MKWFVAGTKKNECLNIWYIKLVNVCTMYEDMSLTAEQSQRRPHGDHGSDLRQSQALPRLLSLAMIVSYYVPPDDDYMESDSPDIGANMTQF